VQSDGVIQAHVSMLLIEQEWRGGGIGASRSLGFRLTREAFGLTGSASD
jgi:hypothetical protein